MIRIILIIFLGASSQDGAYNFKRSTEPVVHQNRCIEPSPPIDETENNKSIQFAHAKRT